MIEDNITKMAREIGTMVLNMIMAHDQCANEPHKRVRKVDGLPYGVHPPLSFFLMLHETSFPVWKRFLYGRALNWHDLKEDTSADPRIIGDKEVEVLVDKLTFSDDMDSSAEAIRRGPEIAMLKSYDTFGNLFGLDAIEWTIEKKKRRIEKAEKLFAYARPHYPELYIWPMADALLATIKARIGI